jgi:hypothetical protein
MYIVDSDIREALGENCHGEDVRVYTGPDGRSGPWEARGFWLWDDEQGRHVCMGLVQIRTKLGSGEAASRYCTSLRSVNLTPADIL